MDQSGAVDLLEECWFFDNLLNRRASMLRCYSHPCSSSTFGQQMLDTNSCHLHHRTSCEEEEEEEESDLSLSKLIQQPTIQQLLLVKQESGQPLRRSLLRSPSLPSAFGREKPIQDNENHRRSTKSRHPSPINSSHVLPPRHASKAIPRSKTTEAESVDNIKEMRRRYLNHSKSRKNLNDFESQEVQGFKDLGFKFEKQDLNPCVVNILPGLQAKTEDDDGLQAKPYLSEEWLVQSYGPKIPHWGANKSPEHIKAQIKYWARAVASNVH